ncbi:MAG: NAD-dependent epimerase/dehydratase family protein [Leptospiraceae bacterium]|nr:NAD-dependent epimerase/dehydratase family protein [Leptospiraceae bacterium]
MNEKNTVLVTGSAGFIGSHVTKRLLSLGYRVIGMDNHNDYYNPQLKEDRINEILKDSNYKHYRQDIANFNEMNDKLVSESIDVVIHLAAQAGVRYSRENPQLYIESNVLGFVNLLEIIKKKNIKHFIYASSSSVYGSNTDVPFSVNQNVDFPLNVYAATKKSNELLAHAYSHLYKIPCTGLRFFTVYGPWGRPDMAPYLFTKRIFENEPIHVFNHGNHKRDFTYVDDVVEGVIRIIDHIPHKYDEITQLSNPPYAIYNIGNNKPIQLIDFIKALEKFIGKKAIMEMYPIQPGDIADTWADVTELSRNIGYTPRTELETGVSKMIDWFKTYYNIR